MPDRQVHTQNLSREITQPELFRLAATETAGGDGLDIEGYWAVFGVRALIDSWEGTFWEENAQGAFKKTLRENTPKMQFDHGRHPLLGSLPLGTWRESLEDDHGALSRGRLSDNWLIEPFRDAIRDEAVTGMSYRFQVIREEWRDQAGKKVKPEDVPDRIWASSLTEEDLLVRTILESKVSEAGPVVWPAYESTQVGVRSKKVTIDLGRLSDPGQRAVLARAVYMADASERAVDEDTTEGKAETADAPPAEGHPSASQAEPADTSQPTDAQPAGQHESNPPPTDSRALLRHQLHILRERLQKGAS
jgi:HK97 family phage prohead protease